MSLDRISGRVGGSFLVFFFFFLLTSVAVGCLSVLGIMVPYLATGMTWAHDCETHSLGDSGRFQLGDLKDGWSLGLVYRDQKRGTLS